MREITIGRALLLGLALVFTSTLTPVSAEAPSAAFLPWNTNDPALARFAYERVATCITEKAALSLLPREAAASALAELNIDLAQVFGLSDSEFRRIGQHLQTRYVLSGALSVMKTLKFTGWRKDVTANLRLHQSSDGAEVAYLQTTTGFSFVSAGTELDAEAMASRVMDQFCDQLAVEAARGFEPAPSSERDEQGMFDF